MNIGYEIFSKDHIKAQFYIAEFLTNIQKKT